MEAIIGYVLGFIAVAVFSSVGFLTFVDSSAEDQKKETNQVPSDLAQLGYLIVVACMVVLLLVSTAFAGKHFDRWWIGLLPYLMYPFMIAYIGLVKLGVDFWRKLQELSYAGWKMLVSQRGMDSVVARLKKRAGNSHAWQGVIVDVNLLAQKIPKITKEIQNIAHRIQDVQQTINQLGIDAEKKRGLTEEGKKIVAVLGALVEKKGRLEALVRKMRETIGLAHAQCALSEDDDQASMLLQEVQGLIGSADQELGVATSTSKELADGEQDQKLAKAKQAAASGAAQRTA